LPSEGALPGPHPVPGDIDARQRIRELFSLYGSAYRWWVTFASMLGSFATLLTGTIINVAIPDVMGALGMTPDDAQWLATGFLAATTVTMLLAAWCVERFGIRTAYLASMVIFLLGSVLGGIAQSGDTLILARLIQGAGSGLMTPVSMLIIFQVFPPHRRGTAMGIYSIGVVLAPALGPVLGGLLIDHLSWRYVFFVAVPFALLSIPLAMVFMPEREPDAASPRFDWFGVILLTIALLALLVALSEGPADDFQDQLSALLFAVTALATGGFIAWELHRPDPMIDLRLFANGRFLAASVVTFIIGAGLYGSTYLLPLFMQTIVGLKATDSGFLMLPAGLMMAIFFPLAGRLSDQMSARTLIFFGTVVFGISAALTAQIDLQTPLLTIGLWALIGRVGLSFIFPCLNAAAMRPLAMHQLAQGSGIVNFLRQLGGAFGINGLAIFLDQRTSHHVAAMAPAVQQDGVGLYLWFKELFPTLTQGGLTDWLELPYEPMAFSMLSRAVWLQGHMVAYQDAFWVIAGVFVLCLIPVACMDPRPPMHPVRR
jgi:DHA2 family multidrug resistance protein